MAPYWPFSTGRGPPLKHLFFDFVMLEALNLSLVTAATGGLEHMARKLVSPVQHQIESLLMQSIPETVKRAAGVVSRSRGGLRCAHRVHRVPRRGREQYQDMRDLR
jgi:hypothetical protein